MVDGASTVGYPAATVACMPTSGSTRTNFSPQLEMSVRDEHGMVWRWVFRAWLRPPAVQIPLPSPESPGVVPTVVGPSVAGFMLTNTGMYACHDCIGWYAFVAVQHNL
jgi:hypothetical protein